MRRPARTDSWQRWHAALFGIRGCNAEAMTKSALITGITGQDGSYLAELLLEQGYAVHGLVRRSSTPNLERISHLLDRVRLHPGDLIDQMSLVRVVEEVRPQEVYHLAAQSFVPASWEQPLLTGDVDAL